MDELSIWVGVAMLALLGALGAISRFGASLLSTRLTGDARRGILLVNVGGAAVAGYLLTAESTLATLVAIGLLGSLTTFSTLAVWIADDIRSRAPLAAVWLILSHLVLGVPAVVAGYLLGYLLR
jgi:CrcB protein